MKSKKYKINQSLINGLLIGILIGALLGFYGLNFLPNWYMVVAKLLIISFFVVAIIIILILLAKNWIFRLVFRRNQDLDDILPTLEETTSQIINKIVDSENIPKDKADKIKPVASSLVNYFLWGQFRKWWVRLLVSIFIAIGGLTTTLLLVQQNTLLKSQNNKIDIQNRRVIQQTYLDEASRRSALLLIMSDIMREISNELTNSIDRKLSPSLTGRIVALTQAFKPYRYLKGDSLITSPISPERGQFLIALLESDLNDSTYNSIFTRGDFRYSELENFNLSNRNLDWINLENSNLKNTNFNGSTLKHSNISNSDCSGSKFINANLSYGNYESSNFSNVDFTGSNLIGCIFDSSILNRCILKNTNFKYSSFTRSSIKYSTFENANGYNKYTIEGRQPNLVGQSRNRSMDIYSKKMQKRFIADTVDNYWFGGKRIIYKNRVYANFNESNLEGSEFINTNLDYANFSGANLKSVNFCSFHLNNIKIDSAILDSTKFNNSLIPVSIFKHMMYAKGSYENSFIVGNISYLKNSDSLSTFTFYSSNTDSTRVFLPDYVANEVLPSYLWKSKIDCNYKAKDKSFLPKINARAISKEDIIIDFKPKIDSLYSISDSINIDQKKIEATFKGYISNFPFDDYNRVNIVTKLFYFKDQISHSRENLKYIKLSKKQ